MADAFKNVFNAHFFDALVTAMMAVDANFNGDAFLQDVYQPECQHQDEQWQQLALKQRMRRVSVSLHTHLAHKNFTAQVQVLLALIPALKTHGIKNNHLACIFIPDFIEQYGIDDYTTSIMALEVITQFITCEFAVRPFILRYSEKMMQQMLVWSKHPHPSVRRLATEGCRPRLPWAMAIDAFKQDPTTVLPILTTLKDDEDEVVRRSVANNLNDIAKDHPAVVIDLAKQWHGHNKSLDALVKHGCRTLLKQGNMEIMRLFGFGDVQQLKVDALQVLTPVVKIGDALVFTFNLLNLADESVKIRLEYGLYFLKANGSLSKKVFKISEKTYAANSHTQVERRQSFKVITTRKFHIGQHQVSVIVNGVEMAKVAFELTG